MTPVAELILADGRSFSGRPFGAAPLEVDELERRIADPGSRPILEHVGELVFNTAMSGYPEVLTDPSYTGQIVAMTYPHIGNYGIDPGWSERGPVGDDTPRLVSVAGLVVRELYEGPVPDGRSTLRDYFERNGIPGISGVDTRALALHLRRNGAQNAVLVSEPSSVQMRERAVAIAVGFPPMEGRGLLSEVGTRETVMIDPPYEGKGGMTKGPHVVLYDCGAKANIVRELQALGCRITVLPSDATASDFVATGADAAMLSNGPGDPAVLKHQVAQARDLIGKIPLMGICLGHQILAEAAGGTTYKMKFGHHGVNHPVRDEFGKRVFVTSQNHGFAVDEKRLPSGMDVWFRNANDGSIEGLRDDTRRIRTTQFHPEGAPGPADSRWIFSAFLEVIPGYTKPRSTLQGGA